MTEATHTLQEAQLRTRLHLATNTLALQAVMKATKHQLRGQGLKVNHMPCRELVTHAEKYLAQHREELIADASQLVERWRLEGFFGKRAQYAKPESAAQTRTP